MHREQTGLSWSHDCLLYLQGSNSALRVGFGAFSAMPLSVYYVGEKSMMFEQKNQGGEEAHRSNRRGRRDPTTPMLTLLSDLNASKRGLGSLQV